MKSIFPQHRVLLLNPQASTRVRVPRNGDPLLRVTVGAGRQKYHFEVSGRQLQLQGLLGESKVFTGGQCTVGRDPVPANNYVRPDDPELSASHFSISLFFHELEVMDLCSKSGTLVEWRDLQQTGVIRDNVAFLGSVTEEISTDERYHLYISGKGLFLRAHPQTAANFLVIERREGCLVLVEHNPELPENLLSLAQSSLYSFNRDRIN